MTEVEHINKVLADKYKTLDNRPLYQIVWSDKATEKRRGTYRDFYGNLFIREVTETRLVPKYNYIRERWIFERFAPTAYNRELPDSFGGTYEPVYVFEDKNRNYLPPTWKAVQFIIDNIEGKVQKDDPKDFRYFEDQEVKQFEEEIGNHPTFRTSGPTRDSIAYNKNLKDVKN